MNLPHKTNPPDKRLTRLAELFAELGVQQRSLDHWASEHAETLAAGASYQDRVDELKKQIEKIGGGICLDAATRDQPSPTLGEVDMYDGRRLVLYTSVSRIRSVNVAALYKEFPAALGVPGVASVSAKGLETAVLAQKVDQRALSHVHQTELRPAFRWRIED